MRIVGGKSSESDMNPMYYYLMLAMFMSLLWGVFVMMVGLVLTNGLGQLIHSYVEDVQDVVDLRGTINDYGINICPIDTAPRNNLYFGDWSLVIGSMVFMSGLLTVLYSLIGIVAAVLRSSLVMLLLLLMIIIVCCVEYYILQVTTDIYDAFHENAKVQMVKLLHKEYILTKKTNMFTGTMNAIMLKTQCCGIRGPADFKNLTFDDGEDLAYFSVSPACCKRSVFNTPPDEKFSNLMDCAKTGHTFLINTLGCYSELFLYLSDNYGILMIVGVSVLVLWQLVDIVDFKTINNFSPQKQEPANQVKFGKLLAVGMAVALIWGILLMVLGIYVRFKFGSVLMELIGDVHQRVNLQMSVNEFGQQLVPYTTIPDDLNFGSWTKLLGAIIISSAILTILFAALGIYSGLNHNKLVLIVTVVILIVTAFLLLGITTILADVESSFHNEAQEELVDLIKKEYTVETTDSAFVYAMNGVMIWFQCCGIRGYGDFKNLSFVEQVSGNRVEQRYFKVAPACCKDSLFTHPPVEKYAGYAKIKACAANDPNSAGSFNEKGCYTKLIEEAQGPGFAFLAVILIWDVLVLVLAILTILEIKPEGEVHPSPSKEAEAERRAAEKEKEEREVVVKKFIPYAKISSFVHPDINRIKSTEIW